MEGRDGIDLTMDAPGDVATLETRELTETVAALIDLREAEGPIGRLLNEHCAVARIWSTTREGLFTKDHESWSGCAIAWLDDLPRGDWGLIGRLERYPSALQVVYLVERVETRRVIQAARLGAEDVLEWPAEEARLPDAVQRATKRSIRERPAMARCLTARGLLSRLSHSEAEVLELTLAGWGNKHIAVRLDLGLRTVEARRQAIFTKLATRSLAEIIELRRTAERIDRLADDRPRERLPKPHFLVGFVR